MIKNISMHFFLCWAREGWDKRYVHAFTNGTWKPGQNAYIIKQYGCGEKYAKLFDPYISRKSAFLTMISVGANSKHPKEVVELIKLLNTERNSIFI